MSWPQAQEHKSIPYTGLSLLQSFHWMQSKALSIPTAASPHPSIRPYMVQKSGQLQLLDCTRVKPRPRSSSCPVSNSWGVATIGSGNLDCSHTLRLFRMFLSRRKPLQAHGIINYTQQHWWWWGEKRFLRGRGVWTHVRADRLIIPFSWVSYYKRKYKQDPRGSKDKVSVSDDSWPPSSSSFQEWQSKIN